MTVHEICARYCYVWTGMAVPLGLRKEGTAVIIKSRAHEQAYHNVCARAQPCVCAIVAYFTALSVSQII